MLELARKTEAKKSPETSLSFSYQAEKIKKSLPYMHGGFRISRKTTCPCDGGCPRCLSIQAKLRIGEPDDEYEKEADRVAEQVMRMPDPVLQPKRNCPLGKDTSCKEDREEELKDKTLMKKEAQAPVQNTDVFPIVNEVLHSASQPLDVDTRAFFEPRFGYDFSDVKIYNDAKAAESARAVNALAYTVGQNVVFGAGQYAPATAAGRKVMGHELTHVIQQGVDLRPSVPSIQRQPELSSPATNLPKTLAEQIHEAMKGSGTNEDTVYRVLSYSPSTVRAVINYYNDNLNDLTGKGLVEDIKDEFSGSELEKAMALLANAKIDENTVEKTTKIESLVTGETDMLWVGLIVRGMLSKEHEPGVMEQHADVVVPDASGSMQTRGFFGDVDGTTGSSASIGMGLSGISADMDWFLKSRPAYVDLELAKLADVKSSLILLKVTKNQVKKLNDYWEDLKKDPGTFDILGRNCSTAAAEGFEKAEITKEISGLDTPDNLFQQLRAEYKTAFMISGYYGYTRSGRKWKLMGDKLKLDNPGSGPWEGPFVIEKKLS